MKRLRFNVLYETNIGTDEEPNIQSEIRGGCAYANDDNFEEVYAFALTQAYNGEITVEDIPDEDTPPSQLDQIEAQVTYTAMMTDTLLEV